MATTQENIGVHRNLKSQERQDNSQSIDPKKSSSKGNFDKGENQQSNGTAGVPPAPGIARVGNTGSETID